MKSFLSKIFPPQQGAALYILMAVVFLVCLALFFVLRTLPPKARRAVIVVTTFIAGLFYAVEFFLPANKDGENALTFAVPTMGNVLNVLQGFALGLGVISLVRIHSRNVSRARPGWANSALLLSSMVLMATAALFFEDSLFFRSLFFDVYASFEATMFAILAFFITSAAFRAFRIRSAEATLMMLAALLVMLGQVPIGQYITSGLPEHGSYLSLLRTDNISNWLLTTVNSPALRAISFGLGVGELAMALRIWLSLERGVYFEVKD